MNSCNTHWQQSVDVLTAARIDKLITVDQPTIDSYLDGWVDANDLEQNANNFDPMKHVWFTGVRKAKSRNYTGVCPFCAVPDQAYNWINRGVIAAIATVTAFGIASNDN